MIALTNLLKKREYIGILFIIIIISVFLKFAYKAEVNIDLENSSLLALDKSANFATNQALQALQDKTDDMYYMQQQLIKQYEVIQKLVSMRETEVTLLKSKQAEINNKFVHGEIDNIDDKMSIEQADEAQAMLQFSNTFNDFWHNTSSETVDEGWNQEMQTSFLEMKERLEGSELKSVAMSGLSCGSSSCTLEFPDYQYLSAEQQIAFLDELVLPGATSVLFNDLSEKGAGLQTIFIR